MPILEIQKILGKLCGSIRHDSPVVFGTPNSAGMILARNTGLLIGNPRNREDPLVIYFCGPAYNHRYDRTLTIEQRDAYLATLSLMGRTIKVDIEWATENINQIQQKFKKYWFRTYTTPDNRGKVFKAIKYELENINKEHHTKKLPTKVF
jgi:hypothetical protein